MKSSQSIRSVFTLTELLVVIAIIGILASFLMPSLVKAMSTARASACANNLKQFGLFWNLYSTEERDWIPPVIYSTGKDQWYVALADSSVMPNDLKWYKYDNHISGATSGKNLQFWKCPENSIQVLPGGSSVSGKDNSYTANGWATYEQAPYYSSGSPHRFLGTNRNQMKRPSKLIAMFENTYYKSDCGPSYYVGTGSIPDIGFGMNYTRWAHNLGANVLFADAHVQRMTPQTLIYQGTSTGIGTNYRASRYTNGWMWYSD